MGHNHHRSRRLAALVVISTMLTMLSATAAFAQYPPAPAFGLNCTPERQNVGQTVACSVIGALRGEALLATAAFNPVFFEEELTANADGEAFFSFEVPAEARGPITVTVVGQTSSEVVTDSVVTLPIQAADPATGDTPGRGSMPRTGMELAIYVLGGALLLGLGGSALFGARRRSRERVEV